MFKKVSFIKVNPGLSPWDYVRQSLIAGFCLFVFLAGWHLFVPLNNQMLFSAIASSALISFLGKDIYKNLGHKTFFGQLIGITIGVLLWCTKDTLTAWLPQYENAIAMICIALSLTLCLVVMGLLNAEHPPAAGTAMAFVFHAHQPVIADGLFVIIFTIMLVLLHRLLKKYRLLKNLV